MTYSVLLTQEAEDDLVDIYRYVAIRDSVARADAVLDRLQELCQGLAELALRGHAPAELERVGVLEFREVHFKPYRVIYEVAEDRVHVHAVIDGRRDLQDLLARRLLR